MHTEANASVPVATRILVVEDNMDAADSLARLLEMFGHEVRVARDGPQALATAASWRPQCVLLDLGLPGMDGYEVARRLRQEAACHDSVVIAVTGHGRPQDRQQSRMAGIDHHLLKPVDLEVLQALTSRPASASGRSPEEAGAGVEVPSAVGSFAGG
jgi:CheY-like chemotaxis protein